MGKILHVSKAEPIPRASRRQKEFGTANGYHSRVLTCDFVYCKMARMEDKDMFTLGMEPSVFKTNWEPPEYTLPHDPVFKYDVTGTDNRDYVQYQIMHNGKQLLWCVHDCLGNITMTGMETPHQALQALEAHLNMKFGFVGATRSQTV